MSETARMFAGACKRRGAAIVLRVLTSLPGPVPAINPPTIANPVVAGPVLAGASTLSLRCATAQGRLIAGDQITVGGVVYTVGATAIANSAVGPGSGFTAVPVTPSVAAPIADATAAAFTWSADKPAYAMVDSYPLRLIDGTRILERDLQLQVPCWQLPDLQPTWRILFNGRELSIVSALPEFKRAEQIYWMVQAR